MEKVPVNLYPCVMTTGFPTEDKEEGRIFQVVFEDRDSFSFKLSNRFLAYILANAVCTRCLEALGNTEHLSTCEKSAKTNLEWSSPRNRMCYVPSTKAAEFKQSWDRERARFRGFERKSKLSKIPLPPEGILLQLKGRQENRCYYCFNEFQSNSSNLKPHLDHFVSVTNGGSNSIFNLVYACGRCNREKFSQNGEQFIGEKMRIGAFSSEIRGSTIRMRRSLDEWKEQFRPEHLDRLDGLRREHYRNMPPTPTPEFNNWLDEEYKLLLRLECIRGENS